MVHNHVSLYQPRFCCNRIASFTAQSARKKTIVPTMHSHFVIEVAAVDLASICKFAVGVVGIVVLTTVSNYLRMWSLNADAKGKSNIHRAFLTITRCHALT
jgi:hypothetical protein